MTGPRYITLKEAAKQLRQTQACIRHLVDHEIVDAKWCDKKLLVSASSFRSWMRRSRRPADPEQRVLYEYAGFTFQLVHVGRNLRMVALPDQHSAAYRDRHAIAALEQWREEKWER